MRHVEGSVAAECGQTALCVLQTAALDEARRVLHLTRYYEQTNSTYRNSVLGKPESPISMPIHATSVVISEAAREARLKSAKFT